MADMLRKTASHIHAQRTQKISRSRPEQAIGVNASRSSVSGATWTAVAGEDIGFRQRDDSSLEAIILLLRAGHAVTLQRSSDALLIADDDREGVFYVLSDNVA